MASVYVDYSLPTLVAAEFDRYGHSATTARAEHLQLASPRDQLRTATDKRWVLLTSERDSYEPLHDSLSPTTFSGASQGSPVHHGIILVTYLVGAGHGADEIARYLADFLRIVPVDHLPDQLYRRHAMRWWRRSNGGYTSYP